METTEIIKAIDARDKALDGKLTELREKQLAMGDTLADLQQKAVHLPGAGNPAASLERKAWDAFIRTKDASHLQTKAWTAGDVDGSNAVPEHIHDEMLVQVVKASPIRQYARVLQANSGDFKFVVANDAQAASWGAESTTRAVTSTAYLNQVAPTGGEQWCAVQLSNWFLEDAMFPAGDFVLQEAARQFAASEAEAFCTGNGTNKPTGLTNGATSAIADGLDQSPQRSFGTFQHIATGVADDLPGDMLSSPQGDLMALLANTVAALRVGYLSNAAWYMSPGTKSALIRKRDLDGRPLVESGLMGNPDRLLGYPIRVAEHLPAIGSNALPIWFGDMYNGYTIADRAGMAVITDQVTVRGHTIYYVSRRVYGSPADTNALKAVKCAAS